MSIMQACADALAAIGRSRSLFGDASAVEAPRGGADLDRAAQTAVAARERTVGLSGNGIDAYQSVVDRSVELLNTAADSDRALATHLRTAAAVTQAGAARLDHIAAQTQKISRAAAGANTPAAQRVILTALRSQLAQTSQVVQSTQQKAAELAGHVRGLHYPQDKPQFPGHGPPEPPKCKDETELLHEWSELADKIKEHNEKTYDPADPIEVAEYEAEYIDLNAKLLELSGELLDCGIPTTINPAPRRRRHRE